MMLELLDVEQLVVVDTAGEAGQVESHARHHGDYS